MNCVRIWVSAGLNTYNIYIYIGACIHTRMARLINPTLDIDLSTSGLRL